MKGIVCLFSLWLLLLTGLPCPDAECHAQENTTTTANPVSHSDDDHGHKAPCSPFCHCLACPGFATPRPFSYTLPATLTTLDVDRQVFAYQSPNQSDIVQAIWQPPKL